MIYSRAFNVAVLQCCNRVLPAGFDVSDTAPDSFESLLAHYNATGRILVWSGASENTIFGDREINYAFRAWHDSRHITGNHGFDYAGECAVAELQIADIKEIFGACDSFDKFERLIRAEVIGQAIFFDARGIFPADQLAFTISYLFNSGAALCGDYELPV